jgi:hypothetical protein
MALCAALAFAAVAAAGGYATATLDPPPDEPVTGEPVELGFTLMQHGVTPTNWGQATLTVIDIDSGERTNYRATPSGSAGHWTVEVIFPAVGNYRFEVTHDLQIESVNLTETNLAVAVPGGSSTTGATPGPSVGLAALAGALGLILTVGLWVAGGLTPRPVRMAAASTPEHA